MLRKKIAVVGAGPSGLVTAKVLQSRGHEVVVIEKECSVGGAFRWRSYEDSRMVSSKYLTAFSDLRIPASADTHLTLDDYVKYLEAYTKKFNIEPIFSTVVESIEKEGEGYVVTCKNANSEWSACYDAVAICSGLHTYPRLVPIEKEHVETMHSANYTSGKNIFQKKRVIIVGTGETAFDAGWAAANNGAKHVTMITRTGFVSIPAELSKALPPLDTILANFGTHAWESNWSRNYSFHWWITTKLNRLGMLLTTGSSIGFNQYCGRSDSMTWDEGRKHVVNKATKCMALLNRPVKTGYFERFFFGSWDAHAANVPIGIDLIRGNVKKIDKDGICLADGRHVAADLVFLATGYRQIFPFLKDQKNDQQNDAPLPNRHFIINDDEPNLAFIGFVRPNVGAIPPLAELQAMWWTLRLENALLPDVESAPCYKLVDRKLNYAVDHGYYSFALAREAGFFPNLMKWIRKRPAVAFAVAFGQAHNPIFRLDGPFSDPQAPTICATELCIPIRQRPLLMNLLFCINLSFFATVNAVAWLFYDCVLLLSSKKN